MAFSVFTLVVGVSGRQARVSSRKVAASFRDDAKANTWSLEQLSRWLYDFSKSRRASEHLSSGGVPAPHFPGVLQRLNLSSRADPAHLLTWKLPVHPVA